MNKKYKVELTSLAGSQLLRIGEYIRNELQAPDAAKRTINYLEMELSKLDTMPERVVLIDMEPWRSRGVHKYVMGNYIAYFVIMQENIVRVTAVCLGRQDQKKQLRDMKISETDPQWKYKKALKRLSFKAFFDAIMLLLNRCTSSGQPSRYP